MIALIDIGSGNIGSVKKALDYIGVKSTVVSRAKELTKASSVIFPGVGHFGKIMRELKKRGFDIELPRLLNKGVPYFGICVGMQILFEFSKETLNPDYAKEKGLGLLKGKVVKFRSNKVPQIGWNRLENVKVPWMEDNTDVYFVNSFYAVPDDSGITAATSYYTADFCAAVEYKNIRAVQFHPEKSGKVGLDIMRKALKC
jgi:glutamine amidotransferase